MSKIFLALRAIITRRVTIQFDKVGFDFKNVPARRLYTFISNGLAATFKSSRVWALPTILQIEPGNICNLRCPVCHVVTENKAKGFMTLAHFKRLIDEVGDATFLIHFWGWGEPFMNPDIYEMIVYGKSKGLQFISSTNGHFFEQPGAVDNLILSGLDVLIFALDGVDSETYERYRHRGDFDRAVQGLERLLQRRRELGSLTPRINLRMLVTRGNEHQIEAMKALAQKWQVDIFSLKTMYSFDNEKEGRHIIPRNPLYQRSTYDADGNPVRTTNRCKKFWNHPVVYFDGEVVLCDYYNREELSLGRIFDGAGNFRTVWNGAVARAIRKRFRANQLAEVRCGNCIMNYASVDRCVSHAFRLEPLQAGGPDA